METINTPQGLEKLVENPPAMLNERPAKKMENLAADPKKPRIKWNQATGMRFGMMTVIKLASRTANNMAIVECICDCGKTKQCQASNLVSAKLASCGCTTSSLMGKARIKHGKTATTEFSIWTGIKRRCLQEKDKHYHRYGGRGITICQRWIDSFNNFLEDMGRRPDDDHTIDRTDNNKGYSKENCKWVNWKAQQRNRRNNRMIEFNGCKKCISEWTEITGMNKNTVLQRLNKGWSGEMIFNTPVKSK